MSVEAPCVGLLAGFVLDFTDNMPASSLTEGHIYKKREPLPSLVRLVEAPRKWPILSRRATISDPTPICTIHPSCAMAFAKAHLGHAYT